MLIHVPYSSHGTEIELSWDHNTQDELAGYYVYYGTSSRNYFDDPIKLPKESVVEIEGRVSYQFPESLTLGMTYYFAVTAYDSWDYETGFSNEDTYLSSEDGPDVIPPTGSVLINSGDDITQTRNVTLTLSATDDGKELDGSALMSFSNDNQMWSVAESYSTAKIWNLSSGEGIKTVYVKFRDVAGNWMKEPAQDQIRYGEDSQNTCDDPHKLQPVLVTASSAFLPQFFAKEKVIDGNPNTLWSTTPSLFLKNESITLDLGEIKKVSSVQMYASKTLFGMEFFPVNFGIQISHDNTAWEEISAEREYRLKPVLYGSWD
ncbi:MAG: discoidin domain-containing protein, partial [Deltaproteobacteria bacterium]|nr:discoidin domain-containing protein [Deltaproteobacteria bacterium]